MADCGVRPSVVVEGIPLCRSASSHLKTQQMIGDLKKELAAQDPKSKSDEQLRADKKQFYPELRILFFPQKIQKLRIIKNI